MNLYMDNVYTRVHERLQHRLLIYYERRYDTQLCHIWQKMLCIRNGNSDFTPQIHTSSLQACMNGVVLTLHAGRRHCGLELGLTDRKEHPTGSYIYNMDSSTAPLAKLS